MHYEEGVNIQGVSDENEDEQNILLMETNNEQNILLMGNNDESEGVRNENDNSEEL